MEGFVKNKSIDWAYAMKRSVRPGGKIPLSEIYEQYGKKHGLEDGEPFITWLKDVKLRNRDEWDIVYESDDAKEPSPTATPVTESPNEPEYNTKASVRGLTVDDVVKLPVRKARQVLPKLVDLKTLQYALAEAKQLPDKDSLCRLLTRRIKELQISRQI